MWCDNLFSRDPIERVGLTKYCYSQDDQNKDLSASPITNGYISWMADAHLYTGNCPPWASSWCQVSPEHPWVANALLGSGEVLASGCAEQPLRAWGCPIWARGFLATVGTAALLAGGEGGHLYALWMKTAFALGGMLLRLPQQRCPVQSRKCFLPRMLSRILRKQWWGNNKRHWLVSRLRCYSELARISKAGVIYSAHYSNTVMFEIWGGGGANPGPVTFMGAFSCEISAVFISYVLCLVEEYFLSIWNQFFWSKRIGFCLFV